MKLSAKITRNRIISTLRWIGLAAVEDASHGALQNTDPIGAFDRFERAARRAAKLKPDRFQ